MNKFKLGFLAIICIIAAFVSPDANAEQFEIENISKIKHEILRVASSASSKARLDNEDNDPAVRAKLDSLIEKLIKISPKQTQAEKLKRVVGAWKSVWSDLSYLGDIPLANSVFQVVFPTGYYYNISNNSKADGSLFGGFVKGEFEVSEPALKIKFVKFARNNKPFTKGTDLATAAMRAELGEYDEIENSPGLGFESIFEQIYVDEDLRIATGRNFDGYNVLFILKRVSKFE